MYLQSLRFGIIKVVTGNDDFAAKHKGGIPMPITADMTIGNILDKHSGAGDILAEQGMHCFGCPSARDETLLEACEVHGLDVCALVARLNSTTYLKDIQRLVEGQ